MAADLKVAVVGAGWMGHVHARAYARLAQHYPGLGTAVSLVAVADSAPAQTADFTARFPGTQAYHDWREMLQDDSIDAVSVTAPNFLHREIGVAVAQAGKHLWIEKPVGLTAADAQAVAAAVAQAGVVCATGFNYRNFPAVARARQAITSGEIGRITHARVWLLTDYAAHPGGPLSWRYTLEKGGHGVLGDLASHGADMARYLLGDIERLVAVTDTFIPQRPLAQAGVSHYAVGSADGPTGPVENEDYVVALARLASGVPLTLESSRAAVGDQNNYGFEVHGTQGLVRWDFRRSDELSLSVGDEYSNQPTSTVFAGPGDGDYGHFQPGAGIAIGYDDSKVMECAAFLRGIAAGSVQGAGIDDAVASAKVLEAIVTSASSGSWVAVG